MADLTPELGQLVTLLPSAARTATPTPDTIFVPKGARGVKFVIVTTAGTPSPGTTPTIRYLSPVDAAAITLLAGVAITGSGTVILTVHPDATAAANTVAKDGLPNKIQLNMAHGDADSHTYSVHFYFYN